MTPQTKSKQNQQDALRAFHARAEKTLQDLPLANTEAEVNDLKPSLEALRTRIAEGVEWWVGYDIEKAGEALQRVEEAFDAATNRVRPRRKFRFRRTVEEQSVSEQKTVASKPEAPVGAIYGSEDVQDGILRCEGLAGRDVTIRGLRDVKVLIGDAGAIRFVSLSNCSVETGKVDGSVWIAKCEKCEVRTQCRQLRIHDAIEVDFIVDVQSGPIIERCQRVRFGPLNDGNMWKEVKDFSWLREGRSPNWTVLERLA